MHRKRKEDGTLQTGYRRLMCNSYASGAGCPVPGSFQAVPVERALMSYCADSMRMAELQRGGDQGRAQRVELAGARRRLADAEAKLARLAAALATDDGVVPITVLRQIRVLETETETEKKSIDGLERELNGARPPASPDMADKWLELMEGVEALDTDARMQAREMVRASFSRITIWHAGKQPGDRLAGAGKVIEVELQARGGGAARIRVDAAAGVLLD